MRTPWAALVLLAAGALHTLAYSQTQSWPLLMLAMALLLALLRGRTPAQAALLGGTFGLGWLAAGVWWLFISMHRYGALPAPLAAVAVWALAAALSLYLAVAAALMVWLWRRLDGLPLAAGVLPD